MPTWPTTLDHLEAMVANAGVVLLDGGLATELERRGADLRDRLWSAKMLVENPELIRQVHLDYFRAGADVGTSASYQASFLGFTLHGLSPRQSADAMRLSVRLVQEARDQFWADAPPGRLRPLVAASVGTYGASLADGSEYRGGFDLTMEELIDWHRPRLETLLDAGPDLIACETIPCLEEGEALIRLLEEYSDVKAWLSFSCKDGSRLNSGEPYVEAVKRAAASANVIAIGVNCTAPQWVEALLAETRPVCAKAILAYPNSGEAWNPTERAWHAERTPLDWGNAVRTWRAAGASVLGGCCRTTPKTIAAMRAAVSLPLAAIDETPAPGLDHRV